jgi:energy-coupling factor transporter ATP-binding protein EcfA2
MMEAWVSYENLFNQAERLAASLGVDFGGFRIVGRVSASEELRGEVPVLVPPSLWTKLLNRVPELVSPGYLLLAVDPKTLNVSLLVVEEVYLRPLTAVLRLPQIHVSLDTDVVGQARSNIVPVKLAARQVSAKHLPLERLVEALDSGEEAVERLVWEAPTESPGAPPDAWSPVVVPRSSIVRAMLLAVTDEEAEDSLTLGALGILDKLYKSPDGGLTPLPLPWSVLKKHVLVTGTTGSGKTSLVKNLIANAVLHKAERDERWKSLEVLILDASGDYKVIALPGSVEGRYRELAGLYVPEAAGSGGVSVPALIAVPITSEGSRSWASVEEALKAYANGLVEDAEAFLPAAKDGCNFEPRSLSLQTSGGPAPLVVVKGACGSRQYRFGVVGVAVKPRAGRPLSSLLEDDPYLSDRARELLPLLDEATLEPGCRGRSIHRLLDAARRALARRPRGGEGSRDPCAEAIRERLQGAAFESTLRNLETRLLSLRRSGIVADPGEPVLDADYKLLREAAGAEGLGARVVVLDLDHVRGADPARVKAMIGYRVLKTLASFREESPHLRSLVVVDEAHLFFPREREGEPEERARTLANQITRLARLGRSRGIGIVFSTHRLDDVGRVIVTLANTKIYFRTDYATAQRLEIPESLKRRLPSFRDHAAIVESYYVRGGFATFIGAPALPGHRIG